MVTDKSRIRGEKFAARDVTSRLVNQPCSDKLLKIWYGVTRTGTVRLEHIDEPLLLSRLNLECGEQARVLREAFGEQSEQLSIGQDHFDGRAGRTEEKPAQAQIIA